MKSLVLLLKRGVRSALSAFAVLNGTLLANTSASASVRIYALWYPSTNPGQGAVVANSGATIGGQFAVRVVVQPNSGSIITASVIHQSITEQTNAHPVSAGQLAGFEVASPNPQYGDPTQNVVVLQSPFVNLAGHNGTYQIQVTVRYVTGPIPFHYGVYEETATMTLTMSNLVLVDSRPEPYFVWKPGEMTGVVFSAQLQHAQAGTCTVKVEIFTSDNNVTPILVKEFTNVPRPGVWQWEWDGRLADGSTAPRGICLYRLSAEARVPTLPDRDSNRSDYLSLRYMSQPGEAQYRGVQGSEAQFLIRYHIASNRPASEGKVVVFDHDLNPIYERTLTGDDLNPADHIVVVSVPVDRLSKPGKYLFLVCVKDNHADVDRSHRRLWALPLALTFEYKRVRLTDPPLVEGSPMLFRGKPMPCPVLIKGEVLSSEQGVRPKVVLTVEKGYLDENGVWQVVEAERMVPETELDWNPGEDVWWDNQAGVWRFRMVWNQRLPRTQFAPYHERYRLRAYALCNRSDSTAVADFRVMSMAKPSPARISSDYTEGDRPAPGMRIVAYVDEYSSGTMAVPIDVDAGWGGPHLGIDYAAQAGAIVNSSEVGVLEDKPLPKPERDQYLGIVHEDDRGRLAAIYYTAQEYISMGYVVQIRCLPQSASRVVFKHSYLGPHRVLKHGMVNLSLKSQNGSTPDEQYERDEVSSAYCHAVVAPHGLPSAGEKVDISVAITRVSNYYVADPRRPRESTQLSLGYVEFQNVILLMQCWKGNTYREYRWRATVRVPSLDGPHLHFEVRRKGKEDVEVRQEDDRWVWVGVDGDNLIRPWGQVNPHHYLSLGFGAR